MSDDDDLTPGQALFCAVVLFLVMKKLIDASEAKDVSRVKKAWLRLRGKDREEAEQLLPLDHHPKGWW